MRTTHKLFEELQFQAATLRPSSPYFIWYQGNRKDSKPVPLRRWLASFTRPSRRKVMQLLRHGVRKGNTHLIVKDPLQGPTHVLEVFWKYVFAENQVYLAMHTSLASERLRNQTSGLESEDTHAESIIQHERLGDLQTVLTGASLGFWEWELATDKLSVSSHCADIVGLLPAELQTGNAFFDRLHPQDRATVSIALAAYTNGESSTYSCRFRMKHAKGHYVDIEATGAYKKRPGKYEDKNLHMVGIHRDISHELASQRELKASHDRTLQMSRLKSKFLANVSHEVRTPIHGIHNMLSLIESNNDSAKRLQLIKEVQSVIEGLGYLLDGLNDFAYADTHQFVPKPKPVNLDALLNTTRQFFLSEARKKQLTIRTRIDPELKVTHHTDEKMLAEIMIELTGNAVKHTETGTINVQCLLLERHRDPGQSDRFEDFVEVKVSDTGNGLPERVKKHLFKPFFNKDFTRARSEGGLGVGLVLVRTYVEALGGTIDVKSVQGEGTTVTVRLALQAYASQTAQTVSPRFLRRCAGPVNKVLVVDDVSMNRRILKTQLSKYGFEVVVAEDGLATLNLFDDPAFECDLILMDIQMPRLEGISCTARLRSEYGIGIPILGVTADATEDTETDGLQAGMDEVLFKPLNVQELATMITHHNYAFKRSTCTHSNSPA